MLILEWQHTGRFGGQAMTLIVINLVFNFAYNGVGGNISIGGHVGGLVGGILVTLAFANWGRGHAAYGKVGLVGVRRRRRRRGRERRDRVLEGSRARIATAARAQQELRPVPSSVT